MAKIRGRFAPIFEELGNDSRWLIDLDDDGKLLYYLILLTIYTTNNSAPDDLNYYVVRYNLRCSNGQLRNRYHRSMTALRHRYEKIKSLFPKLVSSDKKLSMLNYKGYGNGVAPSRALEVEEEVKEEVDKREAPASPPPINHKMVNLKDVKSKLSEAAKYKLYNMMLGVFSARGWRLDEAYVKPIFAGLASKLSERSPRELYPYFNRALVNHINENAEYLSQTAKGGEVCDLAKQTAGAMK